MTHRMVAMVLVLMVAAPGPASPAVDAVVVLKQVLGLSEDQIASVQQLLEARQTAVAPLLTQLHALEPQLAALLDSGSADPATVGELVLSIRALQMQAGQQHHAFAVAFRELLTPGQRTQLEAIEGVGAAARAAEAIRLLGL